jgi:hypothetical protein
MPLSKNLSSLLGLKSVDTVQCTNIYCSTLMKKCAKYGYICVIQSVIRYVSVEPIVYDAARYYQNHIVMWCYGRKLFSRNDILYVCVRYDNIELYRLLSDRSVINKYEMIFHAIQNRAVKSLRYFIENGYNVIDNAEYKHDKTRILEILCKCVGANIEMFSLLIESGIVEPDFNTYDRIIYMESRECIDVLCGKLGGKYKNKLLHVACEYGNKRMLSYIESK